MFKNCKQHVESVNETYFQHLCFATKFGFRLIGAGLKAIIHGICPVCFETAASDEVKCLYKMCANRGKDAPCPEQQQRDKAE